MSASIDYNFIFTLISVQQNLYRIGGPILIVLGRVSNILSLIVFSRKNPCSIYFMAFNIANLILIYASFLPPTLETDYNINNTAINIVAFVFNCLCPSYLILASIDRVLFTSSNALTRRRSSCRNAYMSIICGAVFWMFTFIHLRIFSTILNYEGIIFYCYFQPGLYTTFITYTSLVKETVTPLSMIIFGLWSAKNIRRMRRVAVVSNPLKNRKQTRASSHIVHAKDRQLISMLLTDISIYIAFSSIMAISLMYQQLTEYETKSPEEITIESLVSNVAMYSAYVPFCINSYAHSMVSKSFRNELKIVFSQRSIF